MKDVVAGAMIMGCFTVALLFLRFWKKTRDRLFAMFAAAFAMMAVNRIILSALDQESEMRTPVYVARLLAFVLILVAIIDKNRATGSSS
jgi:hypothetical protein